MTRILMMLSVAILGLSLVPAQAEQKPEEYKAVKELPKKIQEELREILMKKDIEMTGDMVMAAKGSCPAGYKKRGGKCIGKPGKDGKCSDGTAPQTDTGTGEKFCRVDPSAVDKVMGRGFGSIPVVLSW